MLMCFKVMWDFGGESVLCDGKYIIWLFSIYGDSLCVYRQLWDVSIISFILCVYFISLSIVYTEMFHHSHTHTHTHQISLMVQRAV